MSAFPSTAADPRKLAAELRERINPAYAGTPGTESHERLLCAEAIEGLLAQRDELAAALEESNNWLIGEGIYPNQVKRNEAVLAMVKP